MTSQCLISFGSNLGDRQTLIADAARTLENSALVKNMQTSRLFQTPPIGGPGGQEPFLNGVAAFDTQASAREVLELLQQTESELGRLRRVRWDARAIDLDVVLHGELVGGGTALIVPHPRYTARQFVLQPACDVAAHYRDPRFGWTLERLAQHLSQGVPSMSLVGGDTATRHLLCQRLTQEHQIQTFAARPMAEPMAVVGNAPAPLVTGTRQNSDSDQSPQPVVLEKEGPWVSAFLPPLPSLDGDQTGLCEVPRLVARIQSTTPETCWPAPHQLWPSGWRWPEYRLEVSDLDWAVSELASALDAMRCPVTPVTDDGDWWK
ncbi:MAG: 2-amino-4-hydroxy-6-hydroxymethyldihydropteridine diphosphokinase [Rubripirellula sp.]